ncbi:MAG: hypothetical protein IK115_03820 [Lachnospiraceae bacterium]|nr:hypothetical protein [Lachnospiraceae bacterium]
MKEKLLNVLKGKGYTSIFLFPFGISLVLGIYAIMAILRTHVPFGTRMLVALLLLSCLWGGLAFFDQYRLQRGGKSIGAVKGHFLLLLILALLLGRYYAGTIWSAYNHSLHPLELVDDGFQQIDTLFNSSLAESYSRSFRLSTLLNEEGSYTYHSFSHLLLGVFSMGLGIPSFFTYNFLYPSLLVPLYVFLLLLAIVKAKSHFAGSDRMETAELALFLFFLAGYFISSLLSKCGYGNTSFVNSESFLFSNILMLLAYVFIFRALQREAEGKGIRLSFVLLFIPASIVLISWGKVSTGMIYTFSVMYYVFRSRLFKIRAWLANVFYLLMYFVSLRLFSGHGENIGGTITSKYHLFAYAKEYCGGPLQAFIYYLVLMFLPLLFVILECRRKCFDRKAFLSGETLFPELMLAACMLALLPGLIMNIAGGSAGYFPHSVEVIALVLLCGQGFFDAKEAKKSRKHLALPMLLYCCILLLINSGADPLSMISWWHKSDLSEQLLSIRELTKGEREKYTIYLETDSLPMRIMTEGQTAAYVCPALSGVGVINATYKENGEVYSFAGEPVSGWGLRRTQHGPLSFEEALDYAAELGKEKVIRFGYDSYEVVDCR